MFISLDNYQYSINLLSEDLISSNSDDLIHQDALSMSPSPTFPSNPQPQLQTSQISKPNVARNILKMKDGLYDRMFGSDNGINMPENREGKILHNTFHRC